MSEINTAHFFDQIVCGEEGDSLRIPCSSLVVADSVRNRLYRQRNSYVTKMKELAINIGIQRLCLSKNVATAKGTTHFVVLTVLPPEQSATYVKADGSEHIIAPSPSITTETGTALSQPQQRHYDLMIEDGHSEEEAMEGALSAEGDKT